MSNLIQKDIAARAMLLSIGFRKAQRTRKDNDETKALLESHNASEDAAAVIGTLFPGDPRIRKIDQAFNAARCYVYSISFPYADTRALRIVPAERFFEITAELNKHKDNIRQQVQAAAAEYQQMLTDAQEKRNGMFNLDDYPDTPDEFSNCFELLVSFIPFPNRSHILVELGNQAIKELGDSIDQQVQATLEAVTDKLSKQLTILLRRVVENCSKEKPIIRDSLLGNIQDFVATMDAMNLNDSKELASLKVELKGIADIKPVELKENVKTRTDAAKKAADLLKKMSQYGLR